MDKKTAKKATMGTNKATSSTKVAKLMNKPAKPKVALLKEALKAAGIVEGTAMWDTTLLLAKYCKSNMSYSECVAKLAEKTEKAPLTLHSTFARLAKTGDFSKLVKKGPVTKEVLVERLVMLTA